MQRSGIWYKVHHPQFDPELAYQAVDYWAFSETAWANIVFILPTGHTWAVRNDKCTALMPKCGPGFEFDQNEHFSRPLTPAEKVQPWAAKPETKNPDLDTDL